jgi:hypothetical protein
MELLFGSHVRSGGRRIGYLAGVEVDAPSRRVTKIIFSEDGKLGSHAQTRSTEAVRVERGTLTLAETAGSQTAATEPILLSRSVRITRAGHQAGHLAGVAVRDHGILDAAIGRHHWWTRQFRVPAIELDLSHPGEVRTTAGASRAA